MLDKLLISQPNLTIEQMADLFHGNCFDKNIVCIFDHNGAFEGINSIEEFLYVFKDAVTEYAFCQQWDYTQQDIANNGMEND